MDDPRSRLLFELGSAPLRVDRFSFRAGCGCFFIVARLLPFSPRTAFAVSIDVDEGENSAVDLIIGCAVRPDSQ